MDARLERARIIVFDVGNVLLRFQPEKVIALLPADRQKPLFEALFGEGHLWNELDHGVESNQTIARRAAQAAGCPDWEADALRLLDLFPGTLTPLPLYHLLAPLRAQGKRLYGLTNYPEPAFTRTCELFPELVRQLEGIVVSSREKRVKPDEAFFRLLMERYRVDPRDALFIDDNEQNVSAAARLGFSVWHYAGADRLQD